MRAVDYGNDDFEITVVSPTTDISTEPDYYLKPSPVPHDLHAIAPHHGATTRIQRVCNADRT